jgi:hypothetical protein
MEEHSGGKSEMKALFKGQSERAFIFGKLEKLAHAVILLTSRGDTERTLVERVEVSVLDSVREAASLGSQSDHAPLASVLLELVSLLRLSATAGIITKSNSSILVDEYLAVLSRLAAPSVQGIVLRREELLTDMEGGVEDPSALWRQLPGSIDDLFSLPGAESANYKGQDGKKDITHRTPAYKGQIQQTTKGQVSHKVQMSDRKQGKPQTSRSQAILTVVKAKGVVSIRDVAAVITDCSEKTLQRELLALVEQGVLKKEGERRWSTYRLA